MKLASLALAIVSAVLGQSASGQGILASGQPLAASGLHPAPTPTNGVTMFFAPMKSGAGRNTGQAASPNPIGRPEFKIQVPLAMSPAAPVLAPKALRAAPGSATVFLTQKSLLPARPQPGVYESKPYACIVVVPDPYPDDRACIEVDTSPFHMPVIKPDVQFIPRAGAKSP